MINFKSHEFDRMLHIATHVKHGAPWYPYFCKAVIASKLFMLDDATIIRCAEAASDSVDSATGTWPKFSNIYLPFDDISADICDELFVISTRYVPDDDFEPDELHSPEDLTFNLYACTSKNGTYDHVRYRRVHLSSIGAHAYGDDGIMVDGDEVIIGGEEYAQLMQEIGEGFGTKREIDGHLLSIVYALLYSLSDRSLFVLETTDLSPGKRKSKKRWRNKPKRSFERPRYTLMAPHAIRTAMHLPPPSDEGGVKRRGGDVRAHTRILRAERYGDNIGREILIKAHWRGPKENTVGNKRYVVRLDV